MEVKNRARSALSTARSALSRAASRTRQRNEGPPRTTRESLAQWARAHVPGRDLIVLSNREPWSHRHSADGLVAVRNAGGLTVALDAVMQALGGVWVAHGSGDADHDAVDERDHVACPPGGKSRYMLRRLWLDPEEYAGYYSGFANSALWPLCHVVYVRPRFELSDWEHYQAVNRRFAEAAVQEAGSRPALVFIQDYHLALAAKYIKEMRPDMQVSMFWHIPWPNPEAFRVLPWGRELLEGMLANDVLGFHIRRHALNFLDTVGEALEARVDLEHMAVDRGGRRTWVRPFAISVDAEELGGLADLPVTVQAAERIRRELGLQDCKVLLGVDRLDYTKGLPERFAAVERFLEKYPEWRGRFAFIQIGVPSRIELPEYRAVGDAVREGTQRLNERFPRAGGPTVVLIEGNLDFRELVPYYRLADVCAVTSLHDGMNLVAKEYVAASPDLDGALVLSPFTGAARELARAWITSPYDREGLADTIHQALIAPEEERNERMRALRETVLRRNIFDWTLEVLDTIVGLGLQTPDPAAPHAAASDPTLPALPAPESRS
jgi:trehalose 6-phosphate synthase